MESSTASIPEKAGENVEMKEQSPFQKSAVDSKNGLADIEAVDYVFRRASVGALVGWLVLVAAVFYGATDSLDTCDNFQVESTERSVAKTARQLPLTCKFPCFRQGKILPAC